MHYKPKGYNLPGIYKLIMLTDEQIDQLRSEKELLQIEVEDLNMMIARRELELDQLRIRAREANAMQSKLDINLLEFEQMQLQMGKNNQRATGDSIMINELENELLEMLRVQNANAARVKENESLKASLMDTNRELDEASKWYKQLKDLKMELTLTKSSLEIANMELENLKEELTETRELNEVLLKKNK